MRCRVGDLHQQVLLLCFEGTSTFLCERGKWSPRQAIHTEVVSSVCNLGFPEPENPGFFGFFCYPKPGF